jgi:hypothetical protein
MMQCPALCLATRKPFVRRSHEQSTMRGRPLRVRLAPSATAASDYVQAGEDACLNFAPAPHLSDSAKTHSVEPPSGLFISGTSVDNERPSPDPLPVATATYCVPLTL